MTPNPLPPRPAAPTSRSGKGCLTALGIVGAVLLVCCLVGGFALWRAARSESGRQVLAAIGKGVQLAEKGSTAPGAEELRAAGCAQAFVATSDDLEAMANQVGQLPGFQDAGPGPGRRVAMPTLVTCQGQLLVEPPGCDALAAVYVAAAHPRAPFVVVVTAAAQSKPRCEKTYSAQGSVLAPGR
jgi:hypothetical protein